MEQKTDVITRPQNTTIPVDASIISGRYMCDILGDMRDCYKTHNFSYLPSLIEELQYRANRMEDRLHRIKDIVYVEQTRDELKKEVEELEEKKRDIQKEMKIENKEEDKVARNTWRPHF